MPKYARKIDANSHAIRAAYESFGFAVHPTNREWDITVQKIYPDFIYTDIIEIKDGEKPKSARKLTIAEAKLHAKMKIRVVTCLADVQQHVKEIEDYLG